MEKTLDQKIARILADPNCKDFILADAKDADMAFGIAAPGQSPEYYGQEGKYRSLAEYRELICQIVEQGLVDIMLMSASSNELLTIKKRIFDHSKVTPAGRANDATDIHVATGSIYRNEPSRPFRTATIDHIMCGKVDCQPQERHLGADLGLYSMTFNNCLETDMLSLEKYREFRIEAERKGFRHFLEVFAPNAPQAPISDMPRFLNDMIARALGGVVGKGRPLFLKIPYNGPAAMEQLASYDRTLIPGILGGAAGTTFDAFLQLIEAKKYGARVALYGRMINNAEHQLTFVQHLRWIADGDMTDAAEAVRSYHGALGKLGIKSYRTLEQDLQATDRGSHYGANSEKGKTWQAAAAPVAIAGAQAPTPAAKPAASAPGKAAASTEQPDFSKMTNAEKVVWNLARWNKVLR